MNKIFSCLLAVLLGLSCYAQSNDNPGSVKKSKKTARTSVSKKVPIYEVVEETAEFPGGEKAAVYWILSRIDFSKYAQQFDMQGRVIVKFVVEINGSISNVKVVRSLDKDLDEEVVRLVKKMPKWKPGRMNGVAVRSYYTLPVLFRIKNL